MERVKVAGGELPVAGMIADPQLESDFFSAPRDSAHKNKNSGRPTAQCFT
jgi:hypothetical protein